MNEGTKQRLTEILESLHTLDYIQPDSIPDIPLYMDQVTTFMDRELENCKRYPTDKLLTKTMINNYTKNDLIPPPEKKKYSRDHLLLLIYIYYLKSFLSIGDIQKIVTPMIDRFYGEDAHLSMETIYETVFTAEESHSEEVARDIMKQYLKSEKVFADAALSEEDQDYLQFFSFICLLSFDVYVKKQIIEDLIDHLPEKDDGKKKGKR